MKEINREKLNELLTKRVEGDMAAGKIGGAVILVNQNGERVFDKVFGYKNLSSGTKLEKDTMFRLASMTKPITSVALLREVAEGRVDLFAPISDYVPGFGHMTVAHPSEDHKSYIIDRAARGVIRVHNLLSHTSGIGSGVMLYYFDQHHPRKGTLDDVVEYYSKMPLTFDPGAGQAYSATAAFDVAAKIIENTSGEKFADYLHDRIFEPLGMIDTTMTPTEEQYARMITVHGRDKDGKSIDLPEASAPGCVFADYSSTLSCAGGGLASTAEDYSKFAEMLRLGGVGANGARIVPEEMIRKMQTPFVPEILMNCDHRWGLGVRVVTRATYPYGLGIGCFGWSGAYGTHFWVDPTNQITAIYLKNSTFMGSDDERSDFNFERDVSEALR